MGVYNVIKARFFDQIHAPGLPRRQRNGSLEWKPEIGDGSIDIYVHLCCIFRNLNKHSYPNLAYTQLDMVGQN